MREIRLRFSKTGQAKYISHLDTNRVFSRAFARAKLNLWFTQGFNPHPYMSFSLPLSLGVESLCENVDIRILDDISNDEVKKRVNDALPLGIRILDVYDDFMDCHEIVYSDYVYKFEFLDNEKALEKIKEVLQSDTIMAQKKGKQGKRRVLKETDIKQFIEKYSISIRDNQIVLNIRLLAGPDKNLNPSLLFDTIIRLIDMDYEWKSIGRINLLTKDFKEYK
ncbi:TIGR03936 family radical SAM-associated protein [uncultured Eubacterium sp.]|uniref:TIGR03936 family radical SAM-associated protein n=1 Tax=uncultured Eubacterium sp. TaxID=165185 RepID=UPI0025F3AF3E|nr:TIGR03936 family radical SAM-associated protein [uncultured Eubacterium sp.]MDD5836777.1 TIGR03936 family radical SAM-associated protein [Eubacteriales bacterium]